MPRYEYQEMTYLHHAQREGLARLNTYGAEGWHPAFVVGRTVVLMRAVDDDVHGAAPKPEATIDDWRDIYPSLADGVIEQLDADYVERLMGDAFELPTRATLNRWAQEAQESTRL